MQDFDGIDVLDVDGEKVGTVQQTYDDEHGTARFVVVDLGTILSHRRRLIPVDSAEMVGNGLQVPVSRQTIDQSPDASSAGETLTGSLLDQVRAYYANASQTASDAGQAETATADEGATVADEAAAVPVNNIDDVTGEVTPADDGSPHPGEIRDLGDVIEIPIIEEELVKRPVVKEVLRVRKTSVTSTESVGTDIRREDVEVSSTGDVNIRDDQSREG